jgi:putative ABC transport system permease protein
MLRIALSTLSGRKGGMLGAFAAVALAVVLVVSCGILLDSALRTPIGVERLDGASVVVQANPKLIGNDNVGGAVSERSRLASRLAGRLRGLPGVRVAIADRSFFSELIGRDGRLLTGRDGSPSVGHGWSSAALTPFVLTRGHAPRSPTEIVLGAELARHGAVGLGSRIRVVTGGSHALFTVAGIAAAPAGIAISREAPVFFRDDVAARLSGTGDRADLIGVLLARGASEHAVADRIVQALPGTDFRVITGAQRGEAEAPEAALSKEDAITGLTTFALIASFVAIFVVASTFALSVQQRHRELALFRAIGCSPRQVRRMIAGEALIVSIAAAAAASPVGIVAARLEQTFFARAGVLPPGLHVVVGWLPFAGGLLAAVVTTQLAAFASARRASRIRPTDALREVTIQRRPISLIKALAGTVALLGGVAVVLLSGSGRDSSAPASAMVWMLAVALLGPLLAWPFASVIGLPLAAMSRGPGMLARANTRADLRRVASVAVPLILAIGLATTIFFGKAMLQQQTVHQTAERTKAAFILRARTGAGLPPDVAARARALPGVRQVTGSFATSVIVVTGGNNVASFPARAVDASTLSGAIDLGVVSGWLGDLHGRSLAVSSDDAQQLGWKIGDRVNIQLGDGTPAALRVAAIFTRPLGFGEIVLPRALAAGHVTSALDDAVFVTSEPGANRKAVLARLQSLQQADPEVEVVTLADYQGRLAAAARHDSLAVYVLLALIIAFCALASVNVAVMSTTERAREFALLRLIGAGKRQVRAMVRGEMLIVIAFGVSLGTIIATPGLVMVSHDLTGSVIPDVPFWAYGALVAFYATLGFAASSISTRLALRTNPIQAMAARE